MREKLKTIVLFILNPRLLLCFGIAWMITNGWSYVCLGLGTVLGWNWMIAIATAYMAFLWFPFTPEKILTTIIAIFLLRHLFPKDEHTLGILQGLHEKAKIKHREHKEKKREDREIK
jgi:hypothetical protein